MKKQLLFIGVTVFLLMSVSTGFCQIAPRFPRDETLIVVHRDGRIEVPGRYNAWAPGTKSRQGHQQLGLDALWYIDTASGRWDNALARERPIYNDDFTEMTVKLRKGIYWSDGVEFTADDVVFTVETQKNNPGMRDSAIFDLFIDRVYKTDDYTVVFKLKKPNSRFHSIFLVRHDACWIMPKHIWGKVKDPLAFNFYPPVTLGPYVLESYDPAGYWVAWERREDWQRTSLGMVHGMPKPKHVFFIYVGPAEKKVMAQARHELDVIDELTSEAWLSLENKNPYSRCWYKDLPWANLWEPYVPSAVLNNDRYPFSVRDVRWALTLATDIVESIMFAYGGSATMTAIQATPNPSYYKWYYKPMEDWLRNFTLDVDSESFKPYDPSAPLRLAERCREKGYSVPDDPEKIKEIWGRGWWKYAPEIAEKLLKSRGFRRDENGKWLLPDGTPWEITITTFGPKRPTHMRLGFAVAEQWKKFGIDARVEASDLIDTLVNYGDYDCAVVWPIETWGGHPDLFRFLQYLHSDNYVPSGELASWRNCHRWTDERMDHLVEKLRATNVDDPKTIELGIEALKLMVEEMPFPPMVCGAKFSPVDEYYWTNFPTAENPYTDPYSHFTNFRFVLPYIEPTGRK